MIFLFANIVFVFISCSRAFPEKIDVIFNSHRLVYKFKENNTVILICIEPQNDHEFVPLDFKKVLKLVKSISRTN